VDKLEKNLINSVFHFSAMSVTGEIYLLDYIMEAPCNLFLCLAFVLCSIAFLLLHSEDVTE